MDLNQSDTMKNLMRAFAGESQARNRYTIAAAQASQNNLYVLCFLFTHTANQEKEHAKVFYRHLTEVAGTLVPIDAIFPVNISTDMSQLLLAAQTNEYDEHDNLYAQWGETALQEGFTDISNSFQRIGAIEEMHGDRFGQFAQLLQSNQLFVSDVETNWICLNCGHVLSALEAPNNCPVCGRNQGYFIRMELSPFQA